MVEYPIIRYQQMGDRPINETICKRLLLLAWHNRGNHKAFYSYYYYLVNEGLIQWTLGTAFCTEEGKKELDRLLNL